MLSFAFTVLVLVLAAVAGWFMFRGAMSKELETWRRQKRILLKSIAKGNQRIDDQYARMTELEAKFTDLERHAKKDSNYVPQATNNFERMEERYAKRFKQVVGVNEETLPA